MNTTDHDILKNFFSAYFHEDWLCEAETPLQVVQTYLRTAAHTDAVQLQAAIKSFVKNKSDDEALEKKLMPELGCYYLPSADGLTAKSWLISVADILSTDKK